MIATIALSKMWRGRQQIRRGATTLSCGLIAFAPFAARAITPHDESAAKHWHAPRSCIFTPNPIPGTPASLKQGRDVYQARCMGCHGEAGHGDGPDASQLRVRPARLSGERVQSESDGLLWWKITFGRRPMPGFGFRLTSTDRWHLVNYLRTLAEQHGDAPVR